MKLGDQFLIFTHVKSGKSNSGRLPGGLPFIPRPDRYLVPVDRAGDAHPIRRFGVLHNCSGVSEFFRNSPLGEGNLLREALGLAARDKFSTKTTSY